MNLSVHFTNLLHTDLKSNASVMINLKNEILKTLVNRDYEYKTKYKIALKLCKALRI